MEEQKVNILLTHPKDVPFRHPEYAVRDDNGVWRSDENGLMHSAEFQPGEVIALSKGAAQHLIISKQGVPAAMEDMELLNG